MYILFTMVITYKMEIEKRALNYIQNINNALFKYPPKKTTLLKISLFLIRNSSLSFLCNFCDVCGVLPYSYLTKTFFLFPCLLIWGLLINFDSLLRISLSLTKYCSKSLMSSFVLYSLGER